MKTLFLLLYLGIVLHEATARIHSLKTIFTTSSQVPHFPEFVGVSMVDGVQVTHYDSNTMKAELKQEWMKNVTAEDRVYLEGVTIRLQRHQKYFKDNFENLKQRFNHTGGVHIFQWTVGCEWDDETNEVKGHRQVGYDGEDFLAWDTTTNTWVAPKQQGVVTKNKWNGNTGLLKYLKAYLTKECHWWLKKYVEYGRNTLMRTDLPKVSFLQKSPTAPVTCHATGFYPNEAAMHWRKDGVEIHDDVDMGEILPNADGTFQMSVDLSSVKLDHKTKYECVFHFSGEEHLVYELKKEMIRTNENNTTLTIIIIIVVLVVLGLMVAVGVGYFNYKKKNVTPPKSFVSDPEVEQKLNPQPTVMTTPA